MTGFEPKSSGIGSDRSANCAITTAQSYRFLHLAALNCKTWNMFLTRKHFV